MNHSAFVQEYLNRPWTKSRGSSAIYINIERAGHCCNVSVKEDDEHPGEWTYRLVFDSSDDKVYGPRRHPGTKAAQIAALEAAEGTFATFESEFIAETNDIRLCETCGNEILSNSDDASINMCGKCRIEWKKANSTD